MKTAISIPDSLFEEAERLAERLGVSRSELYQRAVARLLEEYSGESITEALDKLYESEPDASRLDAVLEQLQRVSLPDEDW